MLTVLSGCLSMKSYVDPALPIVKKSDIVGSPAPKPLQVAFEFRTKGSLNASATSQMRPRLIAVASESGLFTTVSATAPEGTESGLLTVVIDNIAITDNAAAKGFGTGLTFGAVGSIVTDGYTCTATYVRNGQTTTASAKHALHTTIGNHAGPAGLTPMTPQQAVEQVIDQLSWNVIKQLSDKKAFE